MSEEEAFKAQQHRNMDWLISQGWLVSKSSGRISITSDGMKLVQDVLPRTEGAQTWWQHMRDHGFDEQLTAICFLEGMLEQCVASGLIVIGVSQTDEVAS